MAGIFISYRREDAQGEARHLFDDLKQHFGGDRVFMDVIGIRPGEDYRKVIDSAVASCEVLITLIGREWLQSKTASGQARLGDPRDFVRLETATALKRDVRVIPVLVQGAAMPGEDSLPDELKPLAFRNAIELSHSRWDYDVRVLIDALERVVTPATPSPAGASPSGTEPKASSPSSTDMRPIWRMAAIGAVAASVLGGGGYWWHQRTTTPSPEAPKAMRAEPVAPVGPKPSIILADFAGQTEETAVKAVRDLGLEPAVKRTATDAARAGTVVAQSPAKGATLSRGDTVELTIAAAATVVAVPNLVGKSARDASQDLQAGNLKATWQREPTDDAKPNSVIRQQPPAGTRVGPGTTVEVTTAVPATVEVPRLTGMTKTDALSLVERLSLKYRVEERRTTSERPGMVVGQSPPAGTRARPDGVIDIQVAVADLRTVADLVGKSVREAADLLQKGDLRPVLVREPNDQATPGVVLRQQPPAGARVSSGAEVTLTIAVATSIEVPRLTGLARSEAADLLKRLGLESKWETVASRQYKAGVVVTQNPEPGARVRRGAAVMLTVAVSGDATAGGRCIQGYVWREAFPGDRVCVTPKAREEVADDNRQAHLRLERDPSKRPYGPDTCAQGYVWREASPKDHVCVRPDARARAAQDNREAASRIAR
jgi:beta-lactam-binding protein with PASTA domain